MFLKNIGLLIFTLGVFAFSSNALALDSATIDQLVMAKNIDVGAVKSHGEAVMPILANLYNQTDDKLKRAKIAWLFYQFGWKSEAAKAAMMQDIHTDDRELRLQVQWALGRVSSDDRIVDVLLDTMQEDNNPLFREKSACALASDQIHLTPQQNFKLLEGLVHALGDPKKDVRSNAIKALKIQTGQTKNYNPVASDAARREKVQGWEAWLDEYKANL